MSELKKMAESCRAEYAITATKYSGLVTDLQKSCPHEASKWLQLFDKYGCEISPRFHKRCMLCGKILVECSVSPGVMAKIEVIRLDIEVIIESAIKEDNQTKP